MNDSLSRSASNVVQIKENQDQKRHKRHSLPAVTGAPGNKTGFRKFSSRNSPLRFSLPVSLPSAITSFFRANSNGSEADKGKENTVETADPNEVKDSHQDPKSVPQDNNQCPKGPSWKLSERMHQTRRTRHSVFKSMGCSAHAEGLEYMRLRHMNGTGNDDVLKTISAELLGTLKKTHLCDTDIIGGDNITVKAPSYLLCLKSSVIEGILYPPVLQSIQEDESEKEVEDIVCTKTSGLRQVNVPFATQPAISAALYFFASHKLPDDLVDVRIICQVYYIGKLFKIFALADEACGKCRKVINKSSKFEMSELVCAAFDECRAFEVGGKELKWWGLSFSGANEIKAYATECIMDAPVKFLLEGRGIKLLNTDSIHQILSHQDMDTDELTMFLILRRWVNEFEGIKEEKIEVAKILVRTIDFSLIPPDDLRNRVAVCDFVDKVSVDAALREIELRNSSVLPNYFEHVIVSGAGESHVNGIYVRLEEDIGMDSDDIVFVKDASYEDGDNVDFGLYLNRNTWIIASCADYSNVLYSCEINMNRPNREQTPELGWVADRGNDPPPVCHWNASKLKPKGPVAGAPNLEFYHDGDVRHAKPLTRVDGCKFTFLLCDRLISAIS